MEELKQFDKKIRIMANLETGRDKEQLLGIGGPMSEENRVRSKMAADDKALIAGVQRHVDSLMDDALSREQSFTALLGFLKEKKSHPGGDPFPLARHGLGDVRIRAAESTPSATSGNFIRRIDIATKYGRAIQAPADGIVTEVSYQQDVGQMIQIDHGHGISTFYGHLSKAIVRAGATVRKGDRIGYVGNSGRSTGSHLHYAVMLNGVAVNPRKYLN